MTTLTAPLTTIIDATASAVADRPDAARLTFTTTGRSAGAVATRLGAREHTWTIDEPAGLGGDDAHANPVEAALGALLACQTVTYRFWAARLGIQLDDLELTAEGDLDVRGFFGLDTGTRAGFTAVRVAVRFVGPEPTERYAELQRVVDAHCPVLDLFSAATPVTTTVAG